MQVLSFKIFFLISVFSHAAYQKSFEASFETAENYYKNYEYPKALAAYLKLLKSYPRSPLVISKVAELKLIQENKENALKFLLENIAKFSRQESSVLKNKLNQIGEIFSTEEAQSNYLQGITKKDSEHFESALNNFKSAIATEPSHFLVLKEKALCEQELKLYPEAYETLKSFYALNPYYEELQIQLVELQYYLKKNRELVDTFAKPALDENSLRLWVGLSYLELNDIEKAGFYLKSYFDRVKTTQDPLFFYAMGKIQAAKGYKKEANSYYDKFLSVSKVMAKKNPDSFAKSFDRYRLEEKQLEIKKIFDSK